QYLELGRITYALQHGHKSSAVGKVQTWRSRAAGLYAPFAAAGKLVPRLISSRMIPSSRPEGEMEDNQSLAEDASRGKPCPSDQRNHHIHRCPTPRALPPAPPTRCCWSAAFCSAGSFSRARPAWGESYGTTPALPAT